MLKQLKNVFTTNAEYMHDVIQSKLVKCVRELYPSNWFVLHMFECDSGSRIFLALITRVSNFLLFWWITSIYRTRVNMSTAILPFVCLSVCFLPMRSVDHVIHFRTRHSRVWNTQRMLWNSFGSKLTIQHIIHSFKSSSFFLK